jgi:hypothetical protein
VAVKWVMGVVLATYPLCFLCPSEATACPAPAFVVEIANRRLERVPIKWTHLIDKDAAQIKELEHVLIKKVEQLFPDMLQCRREGLSPLHLRRHQEQGNPLLLGFGPRHGLARFLRGGVPRDRVENLARIGRITQTRRRPRGEI